MHIIYRCYKNNSYWSEYKIHEYQNKQRFIDALTDTLTDVMAYGMQMH